MSETLQSLLLAPAGLYIPMVVALVFTITRPPKSLSPDTKERFVGLFLVGVAFQCVHLIEEFSTGIHSLFPPLFGLAPISSEAFVGFNVFWIGLWAMSAVGFMRSARFAYFPIWFFGLAMCLNGVGHPLLSLWVGGYFPGLVTAPVAGIFGFLITRQLFRITGPDVPEMARPAPDL